MTEFAELPIPPHFDPEKVGEVWRVPYQERAIKAAEWARSHNIAPAENDRFKICLIAIDCQNTFCIPEFELFVGGRSGMGAVEDNVRLCTFIYRNLGNITRIFSTVDTHTAMQIFHPMFWVNESNVHPDPMTVISLSDVDNKRWRVNPEVMDILDFQDLQEFEEYARHYVAQLKERGKYELTVWPYHAMLGGIGHALVSSVEEAVFFHNLARHSQTGFEIKGDNPKTENYSVLSPEVLTGPAGEPVAEKNENFLNKLLDYDAVVVAGQAKSHCLAWTVEDLLSEILPRDLALAVKVYLLEDCTSPVVVPGVVDFTEQADDAFNRFREAGMHVVKSSDPIESWPGIRLSG